MYPESTSKIAVSKSNTGMDTFFSIGYGYEALYAVYVDYYVSHTNITPDSNCAFVKVCEGQ